MNREEAHKLVDWLFDTKEKPEGHTDITFTPAEVKVQLPKDKRVIRTKSTGDNVYEVDDVAKTKRWVKNPQVLEALGWQMSDVQDLGDEALLGYAMGASIHQVDE